jgi:hypothetical protein
VRVVAAISTARSRLDQRCADTARPEPDTTGWWLAGPHDERAYGRVSSRLALGRESPVAEVISQLGAARNGARPVVDARCERGPKTLHLQVLSGAPGLAWEPQPRRAPRLLATVPDQRPAGPMRPERHPFRAPRYRSPLARSRLLRAPSGPTLRRVRQAQAEESRPADGPASRHAPARRTRGRRLPQQEPAQPGARSFGTCSFCRCSGSRAPVLRAEIGNGRPTRKYPAAKFSTRRFVNSRRNL